MKFLVTGVELDFEMEDDCFPSQQEQRLISEGCIGMWEAEDEDDLVEEVTSTTGWCVKSINFEHILSPF